jgi:hypothetical protein
MVPPRIGLGCAGLALLWGLGGALMVLFALADDCLPSPLAAQARPCSDRAHFAPVLAIGLLVLALTAAILWWINRPPRHGGD